MLTPDNIIILRRAKLLNGETAILYIEKDQPDLKRITIMEDEYK